MQIPYKHLLGDRKAGDPVASAAGPTHLFVAEDDAAVAVQSCLEGEAATVLPALEVDTVPLNNKDCP